MPRRPTKGWYNRQGIRVVDRPFFGLSESQKESRFDTVARHEREIFLEEILKHPSLLVRKRAERTNELEMQLMIRAFKQGVDLAACTLERLKKAKEWHRLPRAPVSYAYEPNPPVKTVAPQVVNTYADLSKTLDNIVMRAAGVKPKPVRDTPPKRPAGPAGGTLDKLKAEQRVEQPPAPEAAGPHFLTKFNAVGDNPDFVWRMNDSAGILTFPSVHAAVAILCAWAAWELKVLRYPALALNIAMALSAVPSANHYLIDVLAGVGVAAFSIASITLLTKEASPKTERAFAA